MTMISVEQCMWLKYMFIYLNPFLIFYIFDTIFAALSTIQERRWLSAGRRQCVMDADESVLDGAKSGEYERSFDGLPSPG